MASSLLFFLFFHPFVLKQNGTGNTQNWGSGIKSRQLLSLWPSHSGSVAFIAQVFLENKGLNAIGINSWLFRAERKCSPLCTNSVLCSLFSTHAVYLGTLLKVILVLLSSLVFWTSCERVCCVFVLFSFRFFWLARFCLFACWKC